MTNLDANAIGYLNSASIKAEIIEPTCDYITLSLVTDDAQPPVVVNTWYITESPFSPSKPWKFVKDGINVTATYTVNGVNRPIAPLNELEVPDMSLRPASIKEAIYSTNMIVTGFNNEYDNIVINSIIESYTNTGVDGKLRCIVVTNYNNIGYYSSLEIDIQSNIITTDAFNLKIKTILESLASNINTELGVQHLTVFNGGLSVYSPAIRASNGNSVGIIIDSSNRFNFTFSSKPTLSSNRTITVPISVPAVLHLFKIYTDGKIKDAWRWRGFGYIANDGEPYEFTYSLV